MKQKIDLYRSAVARCTKPLGKWVHDQAATFTMTLCAPTREEAWEVARESFEWYPKAGARLIGSLAGWMAETKRELGNYAYAAELAKVDQSGALDLLTLEYLDELRRVRARHAGRLRRGVPALRGRRGRPAAVSRESRTRSRTTRSCRRSSGWARK